MRWGVYSGPLEAWQWKTPMHHPSWTLYLTDTRLRLIRTPTGWSVNRVAGNESQETTCFLCRNNMSLTLFLHEMRLTFPWALLSLVGYRGRDGGGERCYRGSNEKLSAGGLSDWTHMLVKQVAQQRERAWWERPLSLANSQWGRYGSETVCLGLEGYG